jgi:hypothetical protein
MFPKILFKEKFPEKQNLNRQDLLDLRKKEQNNI